LFDQCDGSVDGLHDEAVNAIVENHIHVGTALYSNFFANLFKPNVTLTTNSTIHDTTNSTLHGNWTLTTNSTIPLLVMANNATLLIEAISATEFVIGGSNMTGTQYLITSGVVQVVDKVMVPDGLALCKSV
jgi:hypothetical protein